MRIDFAWRNGVWVGVSWADVPDPEMLQSGELYFCESGVEDFLGIDRDVERMSLLIVEDPPPPTLPFNFYRIESGPYSVRRLFHNGHCVPTTCGQNNFIEDNLGLPARFGVQVLLPENETHT